MQKIITVSQLATVLWQFLYLSLKPNIAQILSSRISWRRRSRISTTLVLVCIHLIFWLGYVEIWRHGNFSFSSIFRGVPPMFLPKTCRKYWNIGFCLSLNQQFPKPLYPDFYRIDYIGTIGVHSKKPLRGKQTHEYTIPCVYKE